MRTRYVEFMYIQSDKEEIERCLKYYVDVWWLVLVTDLNRTKNPPGQIEKLKQYFCLELRNTVLQVRYRNYTKFFFK